MTPMVKIQRAAASKREVSRYGRVHLGLMLLMVSALSRVNCEAKEFDWGDLGVSLANAKPALGGGVSAASNLRILVSPQRRMTKNYEFEYTNGTQPAGPSSQMSSGGDSSYVVSSSGSPYLAQSVYQLAPNHSTVNHSSAYSALSASLASLKNRLNARGVTLTSTLGDGSQQSTSHLYSTGNSAYGPSVLLDTSQQQQQQQQQTVQQQVQQVQQHQQQSSQPTYLSVSSQQDPQAPSAYSVSSSSS